jgi:hypothetical protein
MTDTRAKSPLGLSFTLPGAISCVGGHYLRLT